MQKFGPTTDKTDGTTEKNNNKGKTANKKVATTKCCSKMLKPQDLKRRPNSTPDRSKLIKQSNGTAIISGKK